MGYFVFWLLCGVASAVIASDKGRSGVAWFFLGVLFGPFALVVAACLSRIGPPAKEGPAPGTRPCPHCRERIFEAARVCRFCGKSVAGGPVAWKCVDCGEDVEPGSERCACGSRRLMSVAA